MTPEQIVQLVSQLGVGGVTAYALYRVLSSVGERMIKSLDRNTDVLDKHTKDDLAAQAQVSERLARIESKIESELMFREATPIEHPAPARAIVGEISGRYSRRGPGGRDNG